MIFNFRLTSQIDSKGYGVNAAIKGHKYNMIGQGCGVG